MTIKPLKQVDRAYWRLKTWKLRKLEQFINEQGISALIEFGSGYSTKLFNNCIGEIKSPLIFAASVEHDPEYARQARQASPLVQLINVQLASDNWYSLSNSELSLLPPIELAFIDGPPANTDLTRLSRMGPPFQLQHCLAETAWFILDDAEREGEQFCIKTWLSTFNQLELGPKITDGRSKSFMQVLKWTTK